MATDWRKMSDSDVIAALKSDTAINRVRKIFSGESAKLEQAQNQRVALSGAEIRRMEFEAAEKLMAAALIATEETGG